MRKRFFKKMLVLAITASMLGGNLVTASAQEAKEVSQYVEVADGKSNSLDLAGWNGNAGEDETNTPGYTGEYNTEEPNTEEPDGYTGGYTGGYTTQEPTTEEPKYTGNYTTQETTTEEPETSVEIPPEYAHLNKWITWTDWDDESFTEYKEDVIEWSEEELAFYKSAVTKKSKETLADYTSQVTLEKWESFFREFDSEYPYGAYERVVTLFPEINLGTGEWEKDEKGLSYIKEDGTKATGWYEMVEDIWYYFDKDGYRTTGWMKENGTWYYLNYAGIMVRDQWWAHIDSKFYYFSKSGAMQTGWKKNDGRWYYFRPSGDMARLKWEKIDGKWYYLWHDGSMDTGWHEDDGIWYYLGTDGAMRPGWQKVDGVWYYFENSGVMKTGWLKEGSNWFYLCGSGAMVTGWKQLGNEWFYFYANGTMAKDVYIDGWYVDGNGYYVANQKSDAWISGRIESLKTKYPDGKYWNHVGYSGIGDTSEIITNTPCYHGYGYNYENGTCNRYDIHNANIDGYSWIKGYQCAGFAFKLSDEIFGVDTERIYYDYSFDAIRIGDVIRIGEYFGSYGHSVVVIGKTNNYITVVECNAGNTCKISWGRTITKRELNAEYKIICETRRP